MNRLLVPSGRYGSTKRYDVAFEETVMLIHMTRGHKSSEIFTYTNPGPFPEWQVHIVMPPLLCFFAESFRIKPFRFGEILWIMV